MVSEPSVNPSDPDLVFALAGGGVYVLEADLNFESDYSPLQSAGADVILRLGATAAGVQGYGRELALTPTHVYVAAGRMGVARFRRSDWTRDLVMEIDPSGQPVDEQVWTISVVQYADRDIVVAGTNFAESDGRILLYDTSQAPSQRLRWTWDADKPVYTVVASKDLAADTLHVFAGSACGGLYGAAIGTATQPWTFPGAPQYFGPNTAAFPRDLALDLRNPSERRLYVAAFIGGVQSWKIHLSPGLSLTPADEANGWPFLVSSGPTQRFYCDALSFDPVTGRLAVGLGPYFAGERQYSSGCEKPVPCLMPYVEYDPTEIGVNVYSLAAPPLNAPILQADYTLVPVEGSDAPIVAIGASMRAAPAGNPQGWDYFIEAASAGQGANVVAQDLEQAPQDASKEGAWDLNDLVPLPTNDACWIQDGVLYVATEHGIVAYDLQVPSPSLLSHPAAIAVSPLGAGGSSLAGFAGPQGRLYGIGPDRIAFYDTETYGPLAPYTEPDWSIPVGGKSLLATATTGLYLGPGGPPKRWLFVPVYDDYSAPIETPRGAIKVFDVGLTTDPNQTPVPLIGGMQLPNTKFYDVAIRPVSLATAIGYASYIARKTISDPPTEWFEIGVVRFWVRAGNTSIGERPVVFYDVEEHPAASIPSAKQVWRVRYDPDGHYIYVGLGCSGLAVYQDPTGVGPLTLLGYKTFPEAAVFEVQRAWGSKLYASTLNDGFLVFDDLGNVSTGSYTVYNVRHQALGFVLDPAVPDRRGVFVEGGVGGLDRMDFTGQ